MIVLNYKVQLLLKKLKDFSPSTYEHSLSVAHISASFGEKIGLSLEDIEKLKIASLLHDIGKLSIPIEILNKPSKLTNDEYEIMKKHTLYAVDLLVDAGFKDKEILDLVLYHHERPDGLGYPKGLNKEFIPYLVSILSICDCYDAMKAKRSYKESKDLEYIKGEFIKKSGTQFDPDYTSLFLSYLDQIDLKQKLK